MGTGTRNASLLVKGLKALGMLDKFEGKYDDRGDPELNVIRDMRKLSSLGLINPTKKIPLKTQSQCTEMVKRINIRLKQINPYRAHQKSNYFHPSKQCAMDKQFQAMEAFFSKYFEDTQSMRTSCNARDQVASRRVCGSIANHYITLCMSFTSLVFV